MKTWLAGICAAVWAVGAAAEEPLPLWSGRDVVMPMTGSWSVTAAHGRVLRAGRGEVRFSLPPLTAGAVLDAVLTVDGASRPLRLYSPAPLTGLGASYRDDLPPVLADRFAALGAADRPPENAAVRFVTERPEEIPRGVTVLFADRRDFPLSIPGEWRSVSLLRAGKPGTLSCLLEASRCELDLRGNGNAVVCRREGAVLAVLAPDFDADSLEQVLMLRTIMKEGAK